MKPKETILRWVKQAQIKARKVLRLVVLPGFDGMPLYDVLVFFIKGLFKGYLVDRAAAIAFNFFLAIFPFILFLFTLIPYIPIPDFQNTLFDLIQEILPPNSFEVIKKTIYDIITNQNSGLLSISVIMAFVFSTSGITAILDGFTSGYHDIGSLNWIKERLEAILLLLILSVLIILSVVLITSGGFAIRWLFEQDIIRGNAVVRLLQFTRWIFIVVMMMFSSALLYYYGTPNNRKFHFFSPGSILATALFIVGTVGFNFYITNFSRYNALYGSIGTLIIFLLYLYFNSIILLIGFELNVSIRQAKKLTKTDDKPLIN